jgi:hypothetical protein
LRLLHGTSRRWLENGKEIVVERAPTAFGPVSLRAQSRLGDGQIIVDAELPSRHPAKRTLLRARVPNGWHVTGARVDGAPWAVDGSGGVDLSGRAGPVRVVFSTAR